MDVEDWFQVENFKQNIPFSSWPKCELRVEENIHRILDLFDAADIRQPSNVKLSATFFILGWVAERLPHLVRTIHERGHEVASHGYHHNLCTEQTVKDLRKDLIDSKKLLEDISGAPVVGYRAPSFAIDDTILEIIEDCDYLYDSSFNSFNMHDRYGDLTLPKTGAKSIAFRIPRIKDRESLPSGIHNSDREACFNQAGSRIFYELPISNLKVRISKNQLPWGGGGYFRLIPSSLFRLGVRSILNKENAYLFYFHPWEIDDGQPRVTDAPWYYKYRHYVNLDKTRLKVQRLLESFKECSFVTCSQYLASVSNA